MQKMIPLKKLKECLKSMNCVQLITHCGYQDKLFGVVIRIRRDRIIILSTVNTWALQIFVTKKILFYNLLVKQCKPRALLKLRSMFLCIIFTVHNEPFRGVFEFIFILFIFGS